MQSLLNVVKSRYFWGGIGFVLLVVFVLLVGAWLDWSMVMRLLVVIGLLVAGIGYIAFEFVRAGRNAQKIEQSIQMQAREQQAGGGARTKAEIEELRDRLEKAIATLKSSSLGGGRRGRNALYALPWYMVIGPPGVGKTTAIKNSGLTFPVGDDGIQGVGGTRNCDWFFSDEAILLDTAGRYMTENEDEEEWHAFLDMLKEHRSHHPINGAVVGMSVEHLLDAEPNEIEWQADRIRRRIGELVEHLEVQFPVYVVFTKCDLIQGFVEFFGDLTPSEREQIWGATFTEEEREQESFRALFERAYDRLYESLLDVRTERLRRSMKREDRRKVYAFPLEFAAAKAPLSHFVDYLFQANPYQETPQFRGFYFTSGTQEGVPIDRVIQSVSEQLDLADPDETGANPDSQTKSYFIKDLFTEAIIPDRHLVEQTSRSVRRSRLVRWGVGVTSAVLVGCFALFAGQALVRSQVSLGQVEEVAEAAAAVQWDGQSSASNLQALDRLREEVGRLEQYRSDPPVLRWGLYRGDVVLSSLSTLFYRKMRPLVRGQFQKIERRLARVDTVSGSLLQEQRLGLRAHLRAYLLLSDEAQRLAQKQERVFLRDHLTRMATDVPGSLVTPSLQDRSGQVETQMARFVRGMSRADVSPFEARTALVRSVRRRIYQKPTVATLYAEIRQEAAGSLEPVRLRGILRESGGASLFSAQQATVPGFFTKRGWNGYVQARIEKEAQNPGKGGWVLGTPSRTLSEKLENPETVARRLRSLYFRDYASAWKDFLRQVAYRSPAGGRGTARALTELGDPYDSPLLYLLARVSAETTFARSVGEKARRRVQAEVETRAKSSARTRTRTDAFESSRDPSEAVHPVTRRFRGLHRLKAQKAASGGASPALTRSLQAIGRMGRLLDRVAATPAKATEVASTVLNGGGEMRSALNTIRDNLGQIAPEVRRTLFDGLVLRTWDHILSATQQHLNTRWRRLVYRAHRKRLKGRYPFRSSPQDAALADVEQFFHPQSGLVARFETKELAPFLREDRRSPKTWEGRGIRLSARTIRFLDAAERIGEYLFAGGSLRLRFELTPEIPKGPEKAPSASQVYIRVHGTAQKYQMGYQPTTTFTWPGERGARLLLRTRAGELGPKRFDGAWAWFRLIQEAEVQPVAQNEYSVRWVFEREGQYSIVTRYRLRSERPQRLFTDPSGFFRIRVPKTLD